MYQDISSKMTDKEAGKQPRQGSNYPRAPPPFPPPNCPRCYSGNTKFCYYNNYSVSQPRYFCKECRRYWTHGGVLRSIPCGGTTRKRGRADYCASSSSQIAKPPPTSWSVRSGHSPASVGAGSSHGHDTLRPETTQTMQCFNAGGFCYQSSFMFNPNHELGGVNAAFGAVNVAFGGGATTTPQQAPSTLMFSQLSTLNGFGEFGMPLVQRPLHHQPPAPPPQPPTAWAGQNMGLTSTRSNNFLPVVSDATAAANVVSINEWSELNDMDIEGDLLQSYKPPSP